MNESIARSANFIKAATHHRPALSRMLELYQHELSDMWDQDLDENGEYGYALDRFWREPDCHAYVAMVDNHYAGFALVDTAVKIGTEGYWMDQFFVLKKYRGTGIGKLMAFEVFRALPGCWEVGQMTANIPAQAFWRNVIADFTRGEYAERVLTAGWWQGIVQCFSSKVVTSAQV